VLARVVSFELRYVLRQRSFWVVSAVYFLCGFVYIASPTVGSALTNAAVDVNSPWAITRLVTQLSYLALLGTAAFAGHSVIRDFDAGVASLLFTTRITRRDYVLGRFLGGLAATLASFSFLFAGLALGHGAPTVDPRLLGPFPHEGLAAAFLVFATPNVVIGAAILFAIALLTRDTVKTWVGAVAILIAFLVSRAFAGAFYATEDAAAIASLLEPFATYAATLTVLDWTPFERNTTPLVAQGLIGWNRVLWLGLALGLVALAGARFRMEPERARRGMGRGMVDGGPEDHAARARGTAAAARPMGLARQLLHLTGFEAARIVRGAPFLVIALLSCTGLWFWAAMYGRAFGTGFHPYTGDMAAHVRTVLEMPLIAIVTFYAADLVWAPRVRKLHELIDATPAGNGLLFLSRLLALYVAVLLLLGAGMATAIGFQLWRGFLDIELDVYAVHLFLVAAPYCLVWATLALALQALVGHRFVAMLMVVAGYVGSLVAVQAGFVNNLLLPGARIPVHYDALAGFGHYLEPALWFRAYWWVLAALLAVVALAVWIRGTEIDARTRWRRLPRGLRGGTGAAAIALALLAAGLGGWIAWNTMVRNPSETDAARQARAAEYERRYADWRDRPTPKLEELAGRLELYPGTRHLEFSARYALANRTDTPIESFLLVAPPGTTFDRVRPERAARVARDREHGVARVVLADMLAPGEELAVDVAVASPPVRGFVNRPERMPVAHDGSVVFYDDFLPVVGYARARELEDERAREDLGLPERHPGVRRPGDPGALREQEGQPWADWVSLDLTIGTAAGQTPIGQGERVRQWREGGRRYARFVTGPPVKLHMGVVSGGYETFATTYEGAEGPVRVAVHHFPGHGRNVERLAESARTTLETLERRFGPYPFDRLKLVEAAMGHPNCRIRSDTLICDRSLGFINDPRLDDPRTPPSALVRIPAGMVSNLYLRSLIMPANVPGATSIADGLGFYLSALVWAERVPERALAETVRDLAWHYFTERAADDDGEGTIVDHVNQTYVGAHKNSVVMYGLEYYLGRDRMIEAIRRFIERHRMKPPPFARMGDLVDALRAVASPSEQAIITDFFERRTLFDIAATAATAEARAEGGYQVTVDVRAAKRHATPDGETRAAPLDYPVELVAFGERTGSAGAREILHRERVGPDALATGELRIEVSRMPRQVGLDPFFRLLDRNYSDNRVEVEFGSAE
jgi:ABC-type transport system involved in multi-copper enzyme maturation permease subunit